MRQRRRASGARSQNSRSGRGRGTLLNEHEICFMFAPLFHAAAARVAQVRRKLGVCTVFNLVGPLTNPARAPFQILGVWQRSLFERVASALVRLGVEKAWVVHCADGLDEITIADKTYVAACSSTGEVETFTVSPGDFGLERQTFDGFRGKGPEENADLIRTVLQGVKSGPIAVARDLVIINAAAALHLAGVGRDLRHAAGLARESIDSGRAALKLDMLVREDESKLMIENIFYQILDLKRGAIARLRADPSSRNFRERALKIRKNAEPHRLRRALESDSPQSKIIAEFKRKYRLLPESFATINGQRDCSLL